MRGPGGSHSVIRLRPVTITRHSPRTSPDPTIPMSHQRELDAVALLRAVGEGVAVFAHDGTPVLVNDRLRRLVGDERADGGFPPRWWPQDEEELLRAAVRTARGDGAVLQGEFTLTRADGSDLVAHVTWDVARDGSDTPVAIVATVQDMTERLLVEEAWMEARRTYELLSANSTDVVARMSSGMRLLYLSPSVTRVLGFPVNRLMGQSVLSFIHPDDLAVARASHEQLVRGADAIPTATVRVRCADGRWVWMEAISTPCAARQGELIETQCQRATSPESAAPPRRTQPPDRRGAGSVARHAGDMISAHDADGRYRMVSDASRTLLGTRPGLAHRAPRRWTPCTRRTAMRWP
ncbi:MAG: PAS domain-containing protein [Thermoleophilia bacterium]